MTVAAAVGVDAVAVFDDFGEADSFGGIDFGGDSGEIAVGIGGDIEFDLRNFHHIAQRMFGIFVVVVPGRLKPHRGEAGVPFAVDVNDDLNGGVSGKFFGSKFQTVFNHLTAVKTHLRRFVNHLSFGREQFNAHFEYALFSGKIGNGEQFDLEQFTQHDGLPGGDDYVRDRKIIFGKVEFLFSAARHGEVAQNTHIGEGVVNGRAQRSVFILLIPFGDVDDLHTGIQRNGDRVTQSAGTVAGKGSAQPSGVGVFGDGGTAEDFAAVFGLGKDFRGFSENRSGKGSIVNTFTFFQHTVGGHSAPGETVKLIQSTANGFLHSSGSFGMERTIFVQRETSDFRDKR